MYGEHGRCLCVCVCLPIPSLEMNLALMRCFCTMQSFTDEWAVVGRGEFGCPGGHTDTMAARPL